MLQTPLQLQKDKSLNTVKAFVSLLMLPSTHLHYQLKSTGKSIQDKTLFLKCTGTPHQTEKNLNLSDVAEIDVEVHRSFLSCMICEQSI